MAVRLMDGVYWVLNDDPDMSYEAFVEMNEQIKPILGLVSRAYLGKAGKGRDLFNGSVLK
ncbi:hypothetical protein [Pseudomonas sp. MPB03]|jgi:hypothetical protein|uniref:hypothetical protein n=1 Tax=Pseudomonas sp. MPB03 TaxID=3388489 RepID=UPI00398552CC